MTKPVLDYEPRQPAGRVGQMGMATVTTWLIVINVAVFVLDRLLWRMDVIYEDYPVPRVHIEKSPPIAGVGYFSLGMLFVKGEVWRLLTFQFIHANLTHLVMNMIGLFFFGPLIEAYLGRRKFLAFYLISGVGGAVGYTILWGARFLVSDPWTALVGASAGLFGILIAAAQIAPNATVLIYGLIPMRLKTLAWILLGIAAYTVLRYGGNPMGGHNAGGEAGHLGGAAVGFLLIRNIQLLRFVDFDLSRRHKPPF